MEISSLNNTTFSNVFNIQALEKITIDPETSDISFSNSDKKTNDFSVALRNNINIIMLSQESLKKIDTETKILDNLHNNMMESNQLDDEKSLEKYNYLLSKIISKFEELKGNSVSSDYFDGIIGAKTLNASDIMNKFDEHKEILAKQKEFFSNNIKEAKKSSMELIGLEKIKVSLNTPFENIDYGSDIKNFLGSLATAQANAFPSHSPQLLT